MIRNIVVGKLKVGVDPADVQRALAAIVALEPTGLLDVRVGLDAQLREESWDFAITSDFVDAAAYQAYDLETEHNRIRRQMFAPLAEQIVRVQFDAG